MEEIARIENIVAEEFIGATMNLVSAGARNHAGRRSRKCTEFGRGAKCQNSKFCYGIDGRLQGKRAI